MLSRCAVTPANNFLMEQTISSPSHLSRGSLLRDRLISTRISAIVVERSTRRVASLLIAQYLYLLPYPGNYSGHYLYRYDNLVYKSLRGFQSIRRSSLEHYWSNALNIKPFICERGLYR